MHKWHIATVLLVIALIVSCGCVGQATAPQATQVPTESPTLATPSPTASIVPVTSAQTPALTTVATTAQPTAEPTPANPLPGPVTLKGVGSKIVWFDTVAPGMVSFKYRYVSSTKYVQNCEIKRVSVDLAGSSVDTNLIPGPGAYDRYTDVKKFNLINPGKYSLSVKSCDGWEITIDNA